MFEPQTPTPAVFFAGAITAYFILCAVHIFKHKKRTRLQTVLAWCFVFWAILNFKDIVIAFPEIYTPQVHNYFILIDGWSTVTYVIFIYELTRPHWTTRWKVLLLSLPFLVFTVIYSVWTNYTVLNTYVIFLWICAVSFFSVGIILSHHYIKYIHENYSNIDEIDITWMKYVFIFAILEQTTYFVISLYDNLLVEILYYISAFAMWHLAFRYSMALRPIAIVENKVKERTDAPSYAFAGNIEEMVESKALYLNKDLTLSDLARAVGTNRTYLSDYFSNHKHTTFYDYINELRIVKKAIPLLQQHPEYTMEFIAAESGFNSLSTFRRAFTKLKGMSPGQYRSEQERRLDTP